MDTERAIQILVSHDMLEEVDKLKYIANECECTDCKGCESQPLTEALREQEMLDLLRRILTALDMEYEELKKYSLDSHFDLIRSDIVQYVRKVHNDYTLFEKYLTSMEEYLSDIEMISSITKECRRKKYENII